MFAAGWYVSYKMRPIPKPITIVKNVEKPVQEIIKVPHGQYEWEEWAKKPIVIDRKQEGILYHISATDGYKKTSVTDKIVVGESGNWKLAIGLGAAGIAIGAGMAFLARR